MDFSCIRFEPYGKFYLDLDILLNSVCLSLTDLSFLGGLSLEKPL